MNSSVPVRSGKNKSFRYNLFSRGQFLVLAGYTIVITETLIGIKLGLTPITMMQTLVLSAVVIGSTLIMILIVYIKKEISIPFEWSLFITYILIYVPSYCYWIYHLHQLRLLGLFSALTAVTVVLTYTNMLQSLMMSLSTLACHFLVLFYALEVKSQPGSLKMELFLSSCLIPAFMLISVAAYYVHKKRGEALRAREELEVMNSDLNEANALLRFEQSRAKIEMELAHDIQRSLFPLVPPEDEAWDVAFVSVPSAGVSGDFYDFYLKGNRLKGLSLFDVSGHGVAPALITILAKPVFFRNFKRFTESTLDMVFELSNRELQPELEDIHSFITGIMLRFCGNKIEYINAGHPDILYRSAGSKTVKKIDADNNKSKGHPIGVSSPGQSYKTVELTTASGDVLIIYSDCLLECRNEHGEFYGDSKIFDSFAAARGETAKEILDTLLDDFYRFAGNNVHDDMTLIVIRKK